MPDQPTTMPLLPKEQDQMTTLDERLARLDGPIHTFFGLSYSQYLVLNRTLMQSMPIDWQTRAVILFNQLDAAFCEVEQAPAYIVTPAEEREYSDLSDAECRTLGIGHSACGSTIRAAGDIYYDRDGVAHDPDDRVLVPLPSDPVPGYNRGRTFIEPGISWSDETATEWCVWYGGDDPDECAGRLVYDNQADAEEMVQWTVGGRLAKRTVHLGAWAEVSTDA